MNLRRFQIIFLFLMLAFAGYSQTDTDDQLAAQYYREGDYEKAVVYYEKIYTQKPSVFNYEYYLDCLVQLKDFKEAEKLVKKQGKLENNSPKYDVEMGYLFAKEGNSSKAEKQFTTIIKELQPRQDYISTVANAFIKRSYEDYAIETYQKGRKIINGNYTFSFELADIYEKKGDYENMTNEYLDLLNKDLNYAEDVQSRLQTIINNDPDGKKSETLKNVLLDRSQKNPSNTLYPELLYWYSIQKKDFKLALMQAKSLDKRLNENGERVFQLAKLLASNEEFDLAIEAYDFILNKGKNHYLYLGSLIRSLDVKYQKITKTNSYTHEDLVALEKEYLKTIDEMGKDAGMIPILRNLAHMQAFYLDKSDDAIKLLEEIVQYKNAQPQDIAEAKIELADILLMTGDVWEATLLYSQVEKAYKNDPIGFYAKFKNAKLSYYIGEFDWAKAQLDVLKAATSKLIANDAMDLSLLISDNIGLDSSTVPLQMYAHADLLSFQNKDNEALATLDTIADYFPGHPLQDEILLKKAEIYIKKSDYLKAAENLNNIIEKYSYDVTADNALFELAQIYQYHLNNPEKAKELYNKLLIDYPGSLFSVEARKRLRYLRGDTDQTPDEMYFLNTPDNENP